jgi:hypothetical protein
METKFEKIGVGLITCDRPEFFKISYDSLCHAIDGNNIDCFIVNDGDCELDIIEKNYKKTEGRTGVAKAKNIALKHFINLNYTHIFLMEDDVKIKNSEVFDAYIQASKQTGIKHFNYALHGNHNLDQFGVPTIRKTVKYPDSTISIDLYPNVLGAFSYYHIDTLKDAGLMDECFYNALEHVDHTYQIIKKGYHPPFRWFADITNSSQYLSDIVPDHQQSKIRNNENFQKVFKDGLDNFIKKNKFSVVNGYGPSEDISTEDETIKVLRNIWKKHHLK